MKAFQKLIISLAAIFGGPALAGSFPTTWRILNSSDKPIDIACWGKTAGGSRPVELARMAIKSGETSEQIWGDEWYNDGLGLQAASWECKAGLSGESLTSSGSFSTDWGQNMILSLVQTKSGFMIRTQNQKGDVAKATTEKAKLAK